MPVFKQSYIVAMTLGVLCSIPINAYAETKQSESVSAEAIPASEETINPFSSVESEFSLDIEDIELIFQTQVNRLVLGDTFGIQKTI